MSRKSAFSVFQSSVKEKVKKENDELDFPEPSPPKLLSMRTGSLPDVSETDGKNECPTTPTEKVSSAKSSGKSEPRFNSFRKSIRKKGKKDPHHEVNLKNAGKENKIQKVFDRSDWTEKIQKDNDLSLEEQFLPEVTKQRKEQEELHSVTLINGGATDYKKSSKSSLKSNPKTPMPKNRKRNHSSPATDEHNINDAERKLVNENNSSQSEKNEDKTSSSGDQVLEWLIAPVTPSQFFSDVWQKKPCFIKRRQSKYNQIWFSTKEFDKILRTQNIQFTKNIDIAVYRDGKRETLNPEGRAFAPTVWKFYEEGCSIRLLNPQTFSKNTWHLCSKLQEYFGCFIGSNVYLTPPGSQGFAPHYDDIEAFIIQLEGKKHWKLYSARNVNEVLPRYSSPNLTEEELGEPILDRVLERGDTLYFPRGVIHHASTPEDSHSLHITISCYQKFSWSDYMEKLIPIALQTAIEEDVEFRKGLPIGCHSHIGISNSNKATPERKNFMKTVQQLMKKMVSHINIDIAADELVLDQMDEFLPPCLTSDENNSSIFGNGSFWDGEQVCEKSELDLGTEVKIIRPGIARVITDEDGTHVHYTVENSRQYKEIPLKRIELPGEMTDAAEFLLNSNSDYVKVKDVPLEDNESKVTLARQLYNLGLLRTKNPLE